MPSDRHTPGVRRTVATILIIVGLVVGAVTITGWWVRRTAFVTSRTEHLAGTILADPVLRDDLASRISAQVAAQLNADPVLVRQVVDTTLARPDVASTFSGVIGDIHARLIGLRTDPVVIGPELLTAAIGDPRAGSLPPVSLEVPQIDQLDTARRGLDRYLAGGAVAAIFLVLAGLALHPWRAAAVGIIGVGLLAGRRPPGDGRLPPAGARRAIAVGRAVAGGRAGRRARPAGRAGRRHRAARRHGRALPVRRGSAGPPAAQPVTASTNERKTSTPWATSSSSCITEISHCSSRPVGSSTPRLMPQSH